MVIEYLEEAINLMEGGTEDQSDDANIPANESLNRAQNCIDELLRSLNLEYELAKNLHQIYIFSKKELMAAAVTGNTDRVARVLKNLSRHPTKLNYMKSNAKRLARPNSTSDLCEILYNHLQKNCN